MPTWLIVVSIGVGIVLILSAGGTVAAKSAEKRGRARSLGSDEYRILSRNTDKALRADPRFRRSDAESPNSMSERYNTPTIAFGPYWATIYSRGSGRCEVFIQETRPKRRYIHVSSLTDTVLPFDRALDGVMRVVHEFDSTGNSIQGRRSVL